MLTTNSAKAPEKTGDNHEDVDLFDSDEEEDPEAARIREERLEAYRKKKEAKPKVAAKSFVTIDIKPWGKWYGSRLLISYAQIANMGPLQMMRPIWPASRLRSVLLRRMA